MMKREEIENMPAGREMDALIWQLLNDRPLETITCRHVDGDIQPYDKYPVGHVSPPNYSTDISAAWKVVEYVDKRFELIVEVHYLFGGSMIYMFNNSKNIDVSCMNKNVPLAICRAALMTTADE